MNYVLFFISFLIFFSTVIAHEKLDSQPLPRPLILEYPEKVELGSKQVNEELQLKCSSWRIAGEANNLSPWKTIPSECADYVKNYMVGRAYIVDLEMVAKEAEDYAKRVELGGDGKDVWVFDVDETLLSNLPYYADHGYGLEIFDHSQFDKWVEKAMAPAIASSLKLYEELLGLGFKVFLLTGRRESHREITIENLRNAGFRDWDKLILRYGSKAVVFYDWR
ncbi:acid phosphatase [Thalictrum thalictroides]|uniref:Acid phosphatase n=1 Tax=Thalictrum thalictroides TaxID=46969 RepID=A0A7J6VYJ2_THATH|nr:acid phosphatase [Thalictrum thalictroides]